MTATDELRRMLDERGVEYSTKDSAFQDITYWPASNRVVASYSCSKYSETENGMFKTQFTPEQAIAATLGRPKAKSHPYGYERDTGAYDCTRCECGCINDISATYCNDCGGEIEIDESAEKEYYDGHGKRTVFAKKHDDGSLEFCERRYVPEESAKNGTLTAEQVREAIDANSWTETSSLREFNDSSWQAIADELNATLGRRTCKLTPDGMMDGKMWLACSECNGYVSADYDPPNYCPHCGCEVKL